MACALCSVAAAPCVTCVTQNRCAFAEGSLVCGERQVPSSVGLKGRGRRWHTPRGIQPRGRHPATHARVAVFLCWLWHWLRPPQGQVVRAPVGCMQSCGPGQKAWSTGCDVLEGVGEAAGHAGRRKACVRGRGALAAPACCLEPYLNAPWLQGRGAGVCTVAAGMGRAGVQPRWRLGVRQPLHARGGHMVSSEAFRSARWGDGARCAQRGLVGMAAVLADPEPHPSPGAQACKGKLWLDAMGSTLHDWFGTRLEL